MQKRFYQILFILLSITGFTKAQTGCQIVIGIVPPVICPGGILCVPYTTDPVNCTPVSIEIKKPGDSVFCQLPQPFCGPGNCFQFPQNAVKGTYLVRLRSTVDPQNISVSKPFEVDSLDFSPEPIVTVGQLAPIRPSYCPTDTVCFKITSLSGAGPNATILWSKNDENIIDATDSTFCITGLFDKDYVSVRITKSARCAVNATGKSDSIPLTINKNPKIKIQLVPPSKGCEGTLNSFVAKLDSAGPDPLIVWTMVAENGRIDTLKQGINDTLFTFPVDSARFGVQVCATVIAGRCKLIARDCFAIKACGQVFLDPPIDASACAGTLISVPYTIVGSFLPSNVFSVQLSDSTGSFSVPINIGNLTSNVADTISALIPESTPGGNCYKIRIVSSLPIDTSDTSACIRVFPKPTAPETTNDSVCKAGSVTLLANTSTAGATFQWFTVPFGGNPVFTGGSWTLDIVRDTIFYVATLSEDGCLSNRTPVRGIINQIPDVEAGPDRRVCVGAGSITLSPFPLGGIWTGDLPVLNNVIDPTGVAPGSYKIRYSVTNNLGCVNTDSFTLVVVPKPIVSAGPNREFCQNSLPSLLTGTPAGGIWTGQSVQSDGTFIPVDAGAGSFSLVYTVTEDGCSASDTMIAEVRPSPADYSVITTNPTSCGTADGTATITGIVLLPTYKVLWSVNTADSTISPTISSLPAGSYTVRIIDTTTGCRRTKAFGLSDPNAVAPVILGLSSNYCTADDTVTMTVNPPTPVGTFVGTGVVGNQFIPSIANIGLNVISYSYDAGGGCTGTASVTVRVNPSPVVNAGTASDTVCGNAAPFQLTGFSPDAPPASWGPSPIVSSTGLVTPALAAIGDNKLFLTRTVGLCSAKDSITLFVYQTPIPVITRNPVSNLCEGGIVTLTANLNNGVTATRYEWFKNGTIIPNANEETVQITTQGSYTVRVTGLGNCEGISAPIQVNFNALPVVSVTPSGILTPCSNNPVVLSADSLLGYTFQWYFGTDSITGANTRKFTPAVTGLYRVRVRNAGGCEKFSEFVNVTILDAPVAPIISPPFADTCLQAGQPITVTVGATGSGLTFEWYKVGPPDQIVPGASGPVAQFNQAGQYYVKVLSSNGCSTNSAVITLKQAIAITVQDTLIQKCQGDNPFVVTGLNPVGCLLLGPDGLPLVNNIFNPASSGDFVLTYQCTNSNGCVSRKNITVSVRPRPQAVILTQGSTNVCQGDTVRLIVNDGISVGYVYQLIRNGVNFGTPVVNPIIPVTTAGNYSVAVSFSGCVTVSNTIGVTIKRKPIVNAGPNVGGCSPVVQNLNVPGLTTPGGFWSGSSRVTTDGNYNSAGFIGCDTLTLTVDSLGCTSSDQMTVCIDSLPDLATAVANASACQLADGAAWVVNPPVSGLTYEWTKVGETAAISNDDSIINVLPGAYQVKISSQTTSCSIIKTAIINSPNNLDVSVLGLPDSVCANSAPFGVSGTPTGGVFSSFANRITAGGNYDPTLPGPVSDTVFYTVSLNGCVGTAKKLIRINQVPVVDAGPNQFVCLGDTIVLKAIQPAGVPLIWVGNQVQDDSLYIATSPGTTSTTVSFGYTLNGCSNTDSKVITVNALPDFSISPTQVTQCGSCNGSATRSIANETGFQQVWRNIASGQIIGGGSSVSNLCVGVYSIRVTNNTTGCNRTETFGITGPTNIDPFVCLSNVPASICQNASPVTIGKCSPSATVFIGGFQTETLNPAAFFPSDINVILTDTDANGCIGVEQKVVVIKAAPIVNVAGVSPLSACTNQNLVQLNNFFPTYDASIPENGWTADGAPLNFITRDGKINPSVVLNDATFQVVYTNQIGAGPGGCLDRDTINFSVYKTPVASILPSEPSIEICNGTSTSFCSQNQQPGLTYTWFLGNESNPPVIGFGNCINASLPGVYRLQLNNNGCKSDLSGVVLLTTRPAPIIASIGSDTIICQGASQFAITPPNVVGVVTTSGWAAVSPTPDNFVNQAGVIFPENGSTGLPGNRIRFIASNGTCSDTAFRTIIINQTINSDIQVVGGQTEICQGDQAVLVALSSDPSYTYEWLQDGVVMPGQNNDTLIVTQPAIYRVKVLVNGDGTCSIPSTVSVNITVKPSPTVTIDQSLVKVCFPGSIVEVGSLTGFSPADGVWSNAGSFDIINPVGNIRRDSIKADGIYPVVLTKTIGTCSDTDTLLIQAYRTPPTAFQASTQAICDGDAVKLTYNNPAGYDLTWKLGQTVVGSSDTITILVAGVVTLVVNNNGCIDSASSTFTVQPKPTFNIRGDLEICKNGNGILLEVANPSPGIGGWSGLGVEPNGVFDPQRNDVPVSGTFPLTYTLTSEFGCVTARSFNVTVNPVPDIVLTADKSIVEVLGPAILSAQGGQQFEWTPANSLSAATGPVVSARPTETTTYTVKVTTDKGCIGSKSIEIVVDQEFKIYDGLSPNGDQQNDVWVIKNIQRFPKARVRIFNRWGNVVFESEKGYPEPWDGTFKGDPVPAGAYYYIVDLGDPKLKPESGSITVVR